MVRKAREAKHPTESIVYEGVTYKRRIGERYYQAWVYDKDKKEWWSDSLHRAVWRKHNGPIPDKHHIHHVDDDWNNNDISNLECLTAKEHRWRHRDKMRRTPEQMRPTREALSVWFEKNRGTKKYKKQCQRRGKITWDRAVYRKYVCKFCGDTFLSRAYKPPTICSSSCRDKHVEKKKVEKPCEQCGKKFLTAWGSPCCSLSCAGKLRWSRLSSDERKKALRKTHEATRKRSCL